MWLRPWATCRRTSISCASVKRTPFFKWSASEPPLQYSVVK
jgi:hypothetical protein